MSNVRDLMKRGGGTKLPPKSKAGIRKAAKHFTTHKNGDFLSVSPDRLLPDADQPRKTFNDDTILELAESIEEYGLLQPILVRFTDDKFIIVAGERRHRAATAAGLKTVPCIVTTGDPEEISLIENIQREDLTPIELATAIDKMMTKHSYSQGQIGKIIGKSRVTVCNILAVIKLPDEIKEDLLGTPTAAAAVSRRTLVEIAREPPEIAKKLYKAAKEGATSEDMRGTRGKKTTRIKARSGEAILRERIDKLCDALEVVEDPERLKQKTHNCIARLKRELIRYPQK